MNAPVVLLTYSRPEHTQAVIEALEKNCGASDTDVYAYTCLHKNESVRGSVERTKDLLRRYEKSSGFRSFTVIEKKEWVPLGPAMVTAVDFVIKEHGRVIVVEDDIVTSRDFLDFMNAALDHYQTDASVFSIGGYSAEIKGYAMPECGTYKVHRSCSWGWATWSDRWEKYDHHAKDYPAHMMDRGFRRRMFKWMADLPMVMDSLFHEKGFFEKNWDPQFCYCQFINGMNTVCPVSSKVKNIGFDGTGSNPVPQGLGNTFRPDGHPWEFTDRAADDVFQKRYNRLFLYTARMRLMIRASNALHALSPRLYYWSLKRYMKMGGRAI